MGSPQMLFFISSILIHLVPRTISQPDFVYYFCVDDYGNYTANSPYQASLNASLSSLTSTTDFTNGFYNFSDGQSPDRAEVIALCRADVKQDPCLSCLNDSAVKLTQLCPNQKEAIGWYDNCTLRYSNRSIYGVMETDPRAYAWNVNNASDPDQFNAALETLLNDLRSEAASGNSVRKFATGNSSANFQRVYGLVQCTPDISGQDCEDCLVGAIGEIPNFGLGRIGGRVLTPSCNLRYETSRFYDAVAEASPPPAPPVSPAPPTGGMYQ